MLTIKHAQEKGRGVGGGGELTRTRLRLKNRLDTFPLPAAVQPDILLSLLAYKVSVGRFRSIGIIFG